MKKRMFIWLAIVFCLLALPVSVSAAEKKSIKVKVNNSYYAVLNKSESGWRLNVGNSHEENPFLARVLYLRIPSGNELKTGYYAFNTKGSMDTRKTFHALNTKIGSQRFKGTYYFGEENGRLYMKGGWTTIRGKKYYLSSAGRRYTNRWVSGYYLLGNGQIAKSMKTPDGYYVDCNGRRCAKEQMRLSGLKKKLEYMIRRYDGSWSVYVKDLKTGDMLTINNKSMEAASVIKLFAMASTYNSIKNGAIRKDSTVNSLLKNMITVSDNDSFNSLVSRHSRYNDFLDGCKTVNRYLKALGCTQTECHRTTSPSSTPFVSDGQSNFTSTRDAAIVLEKIYKKSMVSAKYSQEMLNYLLGQTRRWKIPAGLPDGVKCANKTGENDKCQNDVAIVFGEKTDYVVCIFAETGSYSAVNGIKALSSRIYSYLNV